MTVEIPFHLLRPFCTQVAENPSAESLHNLQQELLKLNSDQLQPIQEYILFPIKLTLLRENRPEKLTIAVVKCLQSLLSLIEICNWQIFVDLFLKLFILISTPEKEIKVLNCSEDLKLSVINCVKVLIERTPANLKGGLYEANFCPALGHGVFILLKLAENERLRSLRVVSILTVQLLFGLTSDPWTETQDIIVQTIRDRLASFLPGICMAMTQVASADPKQGQMVTVTALDTWARVVAYCLDPSHLHEDQKKPISLESQSKIPEVKRTKEWIDSTAPKLQILIKSLLLLVSHPHHNVRLALVRWAGTLLLRCRSPFQEAFVDILECAISLTSDDCDEVSKKCKELLSRLSEEDLQKPLVDILEEQIFGLSTRLPRLLHNTDEKEKLVALNLLDGYITLLDKRMESFLHSTPHLKRLSQAILYLAQPDTRTIPLVLPPIGSNSSDYLRFLHFEDKRIQACLKHVCWLLGCNGDLSVLMDHLLEVLQNSSCHREGAALLINNILVGAASRQPKSPDLLCMANHILQSYLSFWLWEDERNVILKGLLLEGISYLSQVLNNELDLQELLCLLLEQAGADSHWVVHSANTALGVLATNCQYSSVDNMVSENADYLVHCLSMKLKHFSQYPALPGLLNVLFSSFNEDMLLLFQDIIEQLLSTIDIYYGNKEALQLLRVLRTLIRALWNIICSGFSEKITPKMSAPETSRSILEFIVEHKTQLEQSHLPELNELIKETDLNSLDETTYSSDPVNQSDAPTPKPLYVQIVCQVLQCCGHHLRVDDDQTILTSVDVICLSLEILHNREDDLLPMVHQIWGPFHELFRSNCNPIIISKAFDTLLSISKLSKSFIRKRTVDGILPNLLNFLEKYRPFSCGKQCTSQQIYKLQLNLLSHLGDLAIQLELEGNPMISICQMCLSYLQTEQTVELKKACTKTLTQAKILDADAVWWILTKALGNQISSPDRFHLEFRPILLLNSNMAQPDYVQTIQDLLNV